MADRREGRGGRQTPKKMMDAERAARKFVVHSRENFGVRRTRKRYNVQVGYEG